MRTMSVVVTLVAVAALFVVAEADESYTVASSLFGHNRPTVASVSAADNDSEAQWTPEPLADSLLEAEAGQEFELDANGHPTPAVKPSSQQKPAAQKPAPKPAVPLPPLTEAERVQKQLNGFHQRFEVTDPATDHRFVAVDAQAQAELTAQANADLAQAVEMHAEAQALALAETHAQAETFMSSELVMEVDAEAALDLALGVDAASETSPAAKTNENYVCYRWSRPPKPPAKSVPFAPREGHASWLSGNGKHLYTFGGCDRQTLPKNCYGELKQMELATRVWKNRKILGVIDGDKDVTLHMQGAAYAADAKSGQRLFVFGGLRVDATENSKFSNSLDLLYYDKRQKEWSWTHVKTSGEHPPPSQDASLVLVHDQLVLFGGYSDAGFFHDVYTIRTHPQNVLSDDKDPDLWRWKKVKIDGPLPPARRGHSMTVQAAGGSYRAFVFGGVNGVQALSDMYVLDVPNWFATPPKAKGGDVKKWAWKKVVAGGAHRALPAARAHHSALVVRPRHLLVFGGCDPFTNHCFDEVLVFNTRTMTWLPTPPSLTQSALAPVVRAKKSKAKAGDAKAAADKDKPLPPLTTPKRRFPAWNPSARKKLTATLIPAKSRVLVLGGCDRVQCFGDVYEMDLKGVCIDSCGAHGRFVDYRAPQLISRKGKGKGKASLLELGAGALTTAEDAQKALAEQFASEQSEGEDEDEAEDGEEEEETEEIDEEEQAESQRLEELELTAQQALEQTSTPNADAAEDDTIDHNEMDGVFLQVDPATTTATATPTKAGAVDPENKPPRKMKLIRKKDSSKGKKNKKSKKAKKAKFEIGGLLNKLSLEMLQELNKERSFDAKCMCRDGYTGKFCQRKSKCHLNCSGSKRGLCVSEKNSSYCACSPGFWGQGCEFKVCQNNCTSHGVCTPHLVGNQTQTVCKCEAGFWGRDCSLAEEWRRADLEKLSCPGHCSGLGRCSTNYTLPTGAKKGAKAVPQWRSVNEFNLHPLNRPFDPLSVDPTRIKDAKQRAVIEKRRDEALKARAQVQASQPAICQCRAGYGGADCSLQCPLLCSRHGSCNATGSCECDSGWSGAGCNVPTCGADNKCTGHGTCDLKAGRCKCNGSFRGPACDIDIGCSGHGTWVHGTKGRRGHCKCNVGWFLEDCSLQLSCPKDCAGHGRCILSKAGRKAARAFKPLSRTLIPAKPDPNAAPALPRVVQGTCICSKGWQSADCSQKVCPKACNRHGDCRDGTCHCYPGFTGPDCGVKINCPGNCTDALHGACTQLRNKKTKVLLPKCKCQPGWAGADCSQLACPKDCSRAGKCLAGQCKCKPGRFGPDCSIACPKDCSGHGECQSTGRCACDVEYTGADCATRKSCPSKSNAECSGHGLCHIPTATCHCEPGFSGADCSTDKSSCANKDCGEHGRCSFGKCFCQIGYSGDNCEHKTVCKADCSHRGLCNMGRCECNPGWAGDDCSVQVWDNTCPGNCNNHGLCNKGVCSCIAGWTGADCNTVTDFCKGNTCSGRGTCVYNKCECLPGTTGPNCEHGSTCPAGCDPKQGVCLLGTCHCLPGFTGATCSQPQVCPGASALGTCSGHGVCVSGTCACEAGWGGADCSLSTLPAAVQAKSSLCPKDCSGAGVCYLGKCFCVKGFGGADCSVVSAMKCPNDCGGHPPRYDQHGVCHLGKCLCHPGYTGESCEIEVSCPDKCSVNGVCAHGKCFCVAGWTGPACDWPLHGPLKRRTYAQELKAVAARGGCGGCSMHGLCVDGKCVCEPGYGGPQCGSVAGGPLVHRCANNCNGQGTCVFGKCFCHPGWTGAACDKPMELACPNDCSRKGLCRYGRCFCYPGHDGADCSVRANCEAQCGVHGVCLDGRCVCADGFGGEQCNIALERNSGPVMNSLPRAVASGATSGADAVKGAFKAPSFLEANAETDEEAPAHGPSLISIGGSAVAGAHASAAPTSGSAALNSAAGSAAAAPPQAVTVTNYQFPLAPLVLLAFVAGVVCSSFAKCMLDKREQLRRQENLIKPLLVPHN